MGKDKGNGEGCEVMVRARRGERIANQGGRNESRVGGRGSLEAGGKTKPECRAGRQAKADTDTK